MRSNQRQSWDHITAQRLLRDRNRAVWAVTCIRFCFFESIRRRRVVSPPRGTVQYCHCRFPRVFIAQSKVVCITGRLHPPFDKSAKTSRVKEAVHDWWLGESNACRNGLIRLCLQGCNVEHRKEWSQSFRGNVLDSECRSESSHRVANASRVLTSTGQQGSTGHHALSTNCRGYCAIRRKLPISVRSHGGQGAEIHCRVSKLPKSPRTRSRASVYVRSLSSKASLSCCRCLSVFSRVTAAISPSKS